MSFNKSNSRNSQDAPQFNTNRNVPNQVAVYPAFQRTLQENLFYQQLQNDSRRFYHPQNEIFGHVTPVDLLVSNLDPSIDVKHTCNILSKMFRDHCTVISIVMGIDGDNSRANVRVANKQEAQVAISQLDSRRLGCKRITVSFPYLNIHQLRMVVISLLRNMPGQCMHLYKFFEIVRSQYCRNISLPEFNNLADVCKIIDCANGRMIVLTQNLNFSTPLAITNFPKYYCTIHCPNGLSTNPNLGEVHEYVLPNVMIPLEYLQIKVYQLLRSHEGFMPLLSFPICYASHFKQPLPENEAGVPLEHLISCLPIVDIISCEENKNYKHLKLKSNFDANPINLEEFLYRTISPDFIENVATFCREMIDLLINVRNCELLVSYFMESYYRFFGKHCNLADYGFNQLSELFEAVSHVVQVLGYGSNQMLTLTHALQSRRFTIDLLRLINSQSSKILSIALFTKAYEVIFFKPFNSREYGLCSLEDLLQCVQNDTIFFGKVENNDVVSIRKRQQTVEEMRRTQQFAIEVKTILQHFPYCTMPFNSFLPSYHHYFSRECKLSDYGFRKLIELFEAIPETVEIQGFFDLDRKITLTLERRIEVLGTQLVLLLKQSNLPSLDFEQVLRSYFETFRCHLKPERYDCATYLELFIKMSDFVQVHFTKTGPVLALVLVGTQMLELRLWAMLLHNPHRMELKKLKYHYRLRYESNLPLNRLPGMKSVEISKYEDITFVRLTSFYTLAARLYHLLARREHPTPINNIADIYFQKYGIHLCSTDYGDKSFHQLLLRMNFLVTVSMQNNDYCVTLNKTLPNYGVPILNSEPDTLSCPPPPLHLLIRRSYFITPPKPDTPPLQGCWSEDLTFNPESSDEHDNLQIYLPLEEHQEIR